MKALISWYNYPSGIRVAVTLRLLRCGQVPDVVLLFRISKTSCTTILKETIGAINKRHKFSGILTDIDEGRKLGDGLKYPRRLPRPFHGCVGAIDGTAFQMDKTGDRSYPRDFYSRKSFMALPVQYVVNAEYRFLCYSCRCGVSTHD